MSISFRCAAVSDVGLIRKSNQDAGYASTNLIVLADGMGGAAGGDVASSVVVAHLAQVDDSHPAEDILPVLTNTLEDAHAELIARSAETTSLAGLGTTCIAIMRAGNKLGMVHIGDSRAYLLREGTLTQVTHDHTLVQYLVDRGEITPEEAENHPKRNVIMRNIGDTPEPLEIDRSIREAIAGDRWLLCSDGLFGVVSKERITKTLTDYRDLDACANRLVDLALAAGAPDNVTVVLADVVDDDVPPGPPLIVGSAAVDAHRPTRGTTSAAGKLSRWTPGESVEVAQERRSPWARIAATIAVLAIAVGSVFGAYAWSQTQYYVTQAGGKVAIFQGVPQKLGPLTLSHLHEKSDLEVASLTTVAQARIAEPITRGSLAEARTVVADLAAQVREPDPIIVERPTPEPSVFPTTGTPPSGKDATTPGSSDFPTDSTTIPLPTDPRPEESQ
ncbi:PP2C family protein-serine/threonine phosphatase [Trueperella abortisuis]|uniref:PP2C family protein-serine/threonine phosphatase n=1 Tax=Trueperella abortisuis TaxID=445930 RepID=UPI002892F20A|nr:protein phosphatase 2C domain-containing protein [Trueperella abortisuis]